MYLLICDINPRNKKIDINKKTICVSTINYVIKMSNNLVNDLKLDQINKLALLAFILLSKVCHKKDKENMFLLKKNSILEMPEPGRGIL